MSKCLITGVCVLVFSAFMFFGCAGEFRCPSYSGVVTWNSYDGIVLEDFGDDDFGWRLESDCGWQIYNEHRGGWGGILALCSCVGLDEPGIIFVWAWNSFSEFHLAEGWTGETVEGIRIGDSLDDFLAVYPDFVQEYGSSYVLYLEESWVWARFDDQERLIALSVGRYYTGGTQRP